MDLYKLYRTARRLAALCLVLLIAASVGAGEAETTDAVEQEEQATEEGAIEVPVVVEAREIEVQPGHVRFDAEFIASMPGGEVQSGRRPPGEPGRGTSQERAICP